MLVGNYAYLSQSGATFVGKLFMNFFVKSLTVCLSLALLSACAMAPVLSPVTNPPRQMALQPVVIVERPVVALVLGSGAARGFAHVGALKILEEHGIKADIVVGTSAGSVVGALYAGGLRGQTLVEAAQELDISQLTDWMFPSRGVVRGQRLQLYINELLHNRPIEDLQTRFVAVVTRLADGELVAFNHGDAGMAVRASSTVPGLVQPLVIDGQEYVDGGLVSKVPVRIARELGADVVIAIDITRNFLQPDQLQSTFGVMQQAIIIMSHKIAEVETEEADILIRPDVGDIASNGFELRDEVLAAGEAATLAVMDKIKRVIAEITREKTGVNR